MKVKSIGSNMTTLKTGDLEILFSYETPVAGYHPDRGYFRTDQKYSVTTSRHIKKYLDGGNAVTVSQIWIDGLLD